MSTDRRPSLLSRRSILSGVAVAPATALVAERAAARPGPRSHSSYPVPVPKAGRYPTQATTPKHDFRAFWLSVVSNIDWPSAPGLSAEEQQSELIAWLDLAQSQQHNAVILQVRPTADALWPSRYEPWSAWLTGTQGEDPGYDPLGFAVAEAHRRGLELHAWFNPYRVAMTEDPSTLSASHPARRHPEWVIPYGGKLYYNPGDPTVRRFVEDAIMDAVSRYDIDGVHFDDYFYPYPVEGESFDDAASFNQYGGGRTLADWRRSNITTFVTELSRRIKAAKPLVQFGISPFAIWRNQATDPAGSASTAGVQTYDDLYADTRAWVQQALIDYIVPQVYWSIGFTAADYAAVTRWWAQTVNGRNVHLYIGQATYKVDANTDPNWSDPQELSSHLQFNTSYPQVQGNIYFSAVSVRTNALDATGLLNAKWYSRPALVPSSPWLKRRPPSAVRSLRSRSGQLEWTAGSRDTRLYAIYRIPLQHGSSRASSRDLADGRHLAAVLPAQRGSTRWPVPDGAGRAAYVVTAVDGAGNESSGIGLSLP